MLEVSKRNSTEGRENPKHMNKSKSPPSVELPFQCGECMEAKKINELENGLSKVMHTMGQNKREG